MEDTLLAELVTLMVFPILTVLAFRLMRRFSFSAAQPGEHGLALGAYAHEHPYSYLAIAFLLALGCFTIAADVSGFGPFLLLRYGGAAEIAACLLVATRRMATEQAT